MKLTQKLKWSAAVVIVFAACTAGTSALSTTTSSLTTAQCAFQASAAAADVCFATYQSCIAGEGADLAACKTALQACLPPPPSGPFGHQGGGGCQNMDGGGPDHDGFAGDGGEPGHGGPGGHHGGPGGPGGLGTLVQVDATAVKACQDTATACVAANPADTTCFSTERDCVHALFEAAFQAACSTTATTCDTTDPACAELKERCTQGVGGNPSAWDGGTCQ